MGSRHPACRCQNRQYHCQIWGGKKASDAKLDVELVNKSHAYLSALHALQSNLAFNRTTVAKGLEQLYDENKGWGMLAKHKADYIETMVTRTMNLTRTVSQGILKNPTTEWVLKLPWKVQGSSSEKPIEPKSKKPKKVETTSYFYGYDRELGMALHVRQSTFQMLIKW